MSEKCFNPKLNLSGSAECLSFATLQDFLIELLLRSSPRQYLVFSVFGSLNVTLTLAAEDNISQAFFCVYTPKSVFQLHAAVSQE